jgi:deoxycytidylate deaminase
LNDFLTLARKWIPRCSNPFKYYHVAIIVKNSRMLAIGVNNGCRHAEMDALGQVDPKAVRRATLYSIRISCDGVSVRDAKPCPECEDLIRTAGIKRVYYSCGDNTKDGYMEEL